MVNQFIDRTCIEKTEKDGGLSVCWDWRIQACIDMN